MRCISNIVRPNILAQSNNSAVEQLILFVKNAGKLINQQGTKEQKYHILHAPQLICWELVMEAKSCCVEYQLAY